MADQNKNNEKKVEDLNQLDAGMKIDKVEDKPELKEEKKEEEGFEPIEPLESQDINLQMMATGFDEKWGRTDEELTARDVLQEETAGKVTTPWEISYGLLKPIEDFKSDDDSTYDLSPDQGFIYNLVSKKKDEHLNYDNLVLLLTRFAKKGNQYTMREVNPMGKYNYDEIIPTKESLVELCKQKSWNGWSYYINSMDSLLSYVSKRRKEDIMIQLLMRAEDKDYEMAINIIDKHAKKSRSRPWEYDWAKPELLTALVEAYDQNYMFFYLPANYRHAIMSEVIKFLASFDGVPSNDRWQMCNIFWEVYGDFNTLMPEIAYIYDPWRPMGPIPKKDVIGKRHSPTKTTTDVELPPETPPETPSTREFRKKTPDEFMGGPAKFELDEEEQKVLEREMAPDVIMAKEQMKEQEEWKLKSDERDFLKGLLYPEEVKREEEEEKKRMQEYEEQKRKEEEEVAARQKGREQAFLNKLRREEQMKEVRDKIRAQLGDEDKTLFEQYLAKKKRKAKEAKEAKREKVQPKKIVTDVSGFDKEARKRVARNIQKYKDAEKKRAEEKSAQLKKQRAERARIIKEDERKKRERAIRKQKEKDQRRQRAVEAKIKAREDERKRRRKERKEIGVVIESPKRRKRAVAPQVPEKRRKKRKVTRSTRGEKLAFVPKGESTSITLSRTETPPSPESPGGSTLRDLEKYLWPTTEEEPSTTETFSLDRLP